MTYIAAAGIAAAITAPLDSYVVRVANCAGSPELGKRSCLLRSVEGARLSIRKRRSIITLGSSIPRTATAGKNKRELRGRALPDRLGPLSHSWYPVTKKKKKTISAHSLSCISYKSLCTYKSALPICVASPLIHPFNDVTRINFNQNTGHGAFSDFFIRVA